MAEIAKHGESESDSDHTMPEGNLALLPDLLRAEMERDALRSELASERHEKRSLKLANYALRARLDLIRTALAGDLNEMYTLE